MKIVKILAVLLAVYVAIVIAFESMDRGTCSLRTRAHWC